MTPWRRQWRHLRIRTQPSPRTPGQGLNRSSIILQAGMSRQHRSQQSPCRWPGVTRALRPSVCTCSTAPVSPVRQLTASFHQLKGFATVAGKSLLEIQREEADQAARQQAAASAFETLNASSGWAKAAGTMRLIMTSHSGPCGGLPSKAALACCPHRAKGGLCPQELSGVQVHLMPPAMCQCATLWRSSAHQLTYSLVITTTGQLLACQPALRKGMERWVCSP